MKKIEKKITEKQSSDIKNNESENLIKKTKKIKKIKKFKKTKNFKK